MEIFFSLLAIILGTLILRYSYFLYHFFGQSQDMERIFGSGMGGTHTAIQLFGVVLIVGALLFLTGII